MNGETKTAGPGVTAFPGLFEAGDFVGVEHDPNGNRVEELPNSARLILPPETDGQPGYGYYLVGHDVCALMFRSCGPEEGGVVSGVVDPVLALRVYRHKTALGVTPFGGEIWILTDGDAKRPLTMFLDCATGSYVSFVGGVEPRTL